jgi:predicted kinase
MSNPESYHSVLPKQDKARGQYVAVFMGPPLTGKTTAAHEFAKQIDPSVNILDVDQVRKVLFGETGERLTDEQEKLRMNQVYAITMELASQIVQAGKSCVIAGTFHGTRGIALANFKEKHDVPVYIYKFELPSTNPKEIEDRLNKRNTEGSYSNINSLPDALRFNQGHITHPALNPKIIQTDQSISQIIKIVSSDLSR